jgi:molybdopterin-guanine dinucleotide biosynthesis protein A
VSVLRRTSPGISIAGYVLAGGASSRFGPDKALAYLAGQTLLQRAVGLLREISDSVRVIAPSGRYPDFRELTIPDRWPGEGALGGILTALHASRECGYPWNLIVSCDMPFLTSAWLGYMLERGFSGDADVLFPRSLAGVEPMCGCWRTAALPVLQDAFDEGVRKVTDAANRVSVRVFDETHWSPFDPGGRIFRNINTPQDYEAAVRMSGRDQT